MTRKRAKHFKPSLEENNMNINKINRGEDCGELVGARTRTQGENTGELELMSDRL